MMRVSDTRIIFSRSPEKPLRRPGTLRSRQRSSSEGAGASAKRAPPEAEQRDTVCLYESA